jgi:hypothetical protein
MQPRIQWPEGKSFAFTVFDDTDHATIENVKPVYDFLAALGMRTTKSVWPLAAKGTPRIPGATCEEPEYLKWVLRLKEQGFEIGYHNASNETSNRERTRAALDRFRELFGDDPATMANHSDNREGIYWGSARFSGLPKKIYNLALRGKNNGYFRGHIEGDPLFWGDLCKERIRYVRNFVFAGMNVLRDCPQMPYHDPDRPFVNYWYASCDGAEVMRYTDALTEEQQDRLEAEGGACVMYTHFACGFAGDGKLHPNFERLMKRLARKNGWFVPASTLLDFLRERNGGPSIRQEERAAMERRWLTRKLLTGTT